MEILNHCKLTAAAKLCSQKGIIWVQFSRMQFCFRGKKLSLSLQSVFNYVLFLYLFDCLCIFFFCVILTISKFSFQNIKLHKKNSSFCSQKKNRYYKTHKNILFSNLNHQRTFDLEIAFIHLRSKKTTKKTVHHFSTEKKNT